MKVCERITDIFFEKDSPVSDCGAFFDMRERIKGITGNYVYIKKFLNDNSHMAEQCSMDKGNQEDRDIMPCINVKGLIMMIEAMAIKYSIRYYNLAAGKKMRSEEDKFRQRKEGFDPNNS